MKTVANNQVAYLQEVFERNSDRTLLLDVRSDQTLTYGEFLQQSLSMASMLRSRHIGPGDSVAFSIENCVELSALYFACMHVGAQIVPINPAFHADDFRDILQRNLPRLLFVSPSVRSRWKELLDSSIGTEVLCFLPEYEAARSKTQGFINFDYQAELNRHNASEKQFVMGDEDPFLIITTSGTTSAPKGIEISCGGLVGNARAFNERVGIGAENRFYNILPMSWLGGFYNLMLLPIVAQGSIVLDGTFGPSNLYAFWERVKEYQINTLWFTSTMLSMLLAIEDEMDLSFLARDIRVGLCGMAPLPVELKRRFENRFGFTLYENYGLSETTFLTTNHPGLPSYKNGSVGPVLDGVSLTICGPDGEKLPAGQEGEVVSATPFRMLGYRHCGETDKANVLDQRWFKTGDIGYLDEEGELFITGRVKDLIIRGGINISPKAIEDVVFELDFVEQVAVVGIPHPVYGEDVAIAIKLRSDAKDITSEDVTKHCRKRIASFQQPRYVFFFDEIPIGATGKIQKGVVRRLIQNKVDPLGNTCAA